MKRGLPIIGLGLAGALLAYGCLYFAGTAAKRELLRNEQPELAWLKREFNLTDAEFARLAQQHASYLPQCEAMCRRIEANNASLSRLLASASAMTPEIEAAIAEAARLRGECQQNMMRHYFEVSRPMPPEQGRRYLEWIYRQTILPEQSMRPMGHAARP